MIVNEMMRRIYKLALVFLPVMPLNACVTAADVPQIEERRIQTVKNEEKCRKLARAAQVCTSMLIQVWSCDTDEECTTPLTAAEVQRVREILCERLKPYSGPPCDSDISWAYHSHLSFLDAAGKEILQMDSLDLTDGSRTDCDDPLGICGLACGVVPADDYAFIRLLFDKAKRP